MKPINDTYDWRDVLDSLSCSLCSGYTKHGQQHCLACREAMARVAKIVKDTVVRPIPRHDLDSGEINPKWIVEYRLRRVLNGEAANG